jgi:hypothetical protein
LFGNEVPYGRARVGGEFGAVDEALPAFMGKRGRGMGWGLLLDEVEEAVLGSPIHQDVQLFGAGELGLQGPVVEVAVNMFKVDSDGETGL